LTLALLFDLSVPCVKFYVQEVAGIVIKI